MPKTLTQEAERLYSELEHSKRRQRDAARVIAVREMMLDPNRLEFARWLIATGRITDYA